VRNYPASKTYYSKVASIIFVLVFVLPAIITEVVSEHKHCETNFNYNPIDERFRLNKYAQNILFNEEVVSVDEKADSSINGRKYDITSQSNDEASKYSVIESGIDDFSARDCLPLEPLELSLGYCVESVETNHNFDYFKLDPSTVSTDKCIYPSVPHRDNPDDWVVNTSMYINDTIHENFRGNIIMAPRKNLCKFLIIFQSI